MTKLEETYQKMEEELARYNRELSAGKQPKKPEYNPSLFWDFRGWQQKKLAKEFAESDFDKFIEKAKSKRTEPR